VRGIIVMKKIIWLSVVVLILSFAGISYARQEIDNCFNFKRAKDYQRAIEAGKKAVRLYPRSVDAHFCLGASYKLVGKLTLALSSMKEAERLATSKNDLMFIYNRLGLIYDGKGNLDKALFYNSKFLSLSRELGNKKQESDALNNIAMIYDEKGELDKALDFYEQSLRLRPEKERATTYNNIAMIYHKKGDYKKAVEYLTKAIEIGTRIGDYRGAAKGMLNLGNTYRKAKNFSEAEENLNEGLKRILKVGDKFWEAYAYKCFGWLYEDTGNIKLAKDYLTKAYELFNSISAKGMAQNVSRSLLLLEKQKK
jgi:tetratricopeptide (TPR) repeat protein